MSYTFIVRPRFFNEKLLFAVLILTTFVLLGACSGGREKSKGDSPTTPATDSIALQLDRLSAPGTLVSDSILSVLNRVRAHAYDLSYNKGVAKADFLIGSWYYKQNRLTESLARFDSAHLLAGEIGDTLLKARCLERMASIHLSTDDPNLALRLYFECRLLFEQVHDSSGIAKIDNILGIYQLDKGHYDSAEFYLRRSYSYNSLKQDTFYALENLSNLGYLEEKRGNYPRARTIYDTLIRQFHLLGDSTALPVVYYNLGSLHQQIHQPDAALKYLDTALRICRKKGDTVMLSVLCGNTGEILLKLGRTDEAARSLNEALSYSRTIKDPETEITVLEFLVRIDSINGDHRTAVGRLRQVSVLKDTLCAQRLRNNLKASELKYENSKQQQTIELQQGHLLAHRKDKFLYLFLFIFASLAGLVLIRLLTVNRKHYRKNLQFREQELQIKKLELEGMQRDDELNRIRLKMTEENLRANDRELVNIALQMDQRNELLEFLLKKLTPDPEKTSKADASQVLKELEKTLRRKIHETQNEDLFNEKFSMIHQDFFPKLKSAHPLLTKSELRFCAYLRIHLSSNQIASLLNVTGEAVRKNRYRIRKKMELDPEASLEDYLMKF